MPLTDYHRDMIKSDKADLNSIGNGTHDAGSGQAAGFLAYFVE